jgi:hypothetical protein
MGGPGPIPSPRPNLPHPNHHPTEHTPPTPSPHPTCPPKTVTHPTCPPQPSFCTTCRISVVVFLLPSTPPATLLQTGCPIHDSSIVMGGPGPIPSPHPTYPTKPSPHRTCPPKPSPHPTYPTPTVILHDVQNLCSCLSSPLQLPQPRSYKRGAPFMTAPSS